jgi:RNA polymerase sigma factor (sigma-70 family)
MMRRKRFHPTTTPGLDVDEFLALYKERWESLLRFFVRRTLDPETAAELTAETFAEAFASRDGFDASKGEPGAWLFGIARHQLSGYLRTLMVDRSARERIGLPVRTLSSEDHERIEQMIDFAEVGRQVRAALRDLTAEQREAVVYRVVDGLSYSEISNRIGCSEETARARVSRALRLLAQQITPPDGDIQEARI